MRRVLRENGLSLALLGLFLAAIAGQFAAGHAAHNAELAAHGLPAIAASAYLADPHFLSAVFENHESEWLQMLVFVLLSRWLRQKGSSESKGFDGPEDVDAPAARVGRAPRWVRENSLSLALGALFLGAFAIHWWQSARLAAAEDIAHGQPTAALLAHIADPRFLAESLQNWQSEFLSTAVLILLAVRLRQRGSPQSKPVDAPDHQTGR